MTTTETMTAAVAQKGWKPEYARVLDEKRGNWFALVSQPDGPPLMVFGENDAVVTMEIGVVRRLEHSLGQVPS